MFYVSGSWYIQDLWYKLSSMCPKLADQRDYSRYKYLRYSSTITLDTDPYTVVGPIATFVTYMRVYVEKMGKFTFRHILENLLGV